MFTGAQPVAHRCYTHGISYPSNFSKCRVNGCAVSLQRVEGAYDPDWEEKADEFNNPREELPEEVNVAGWRLLGLLEAGYDLESAQEVARAPVDLHYACDLVTKKGCPADLAAKILT